MCFFLSSMLKTPDHHNVNRTAKLFFRFLEIFLLNSYAIIFIFNFESALKLYFVLSVSIILPSPPPRQGFRAAIFPAVFLHVTLDELIEIGSNSNHCTCSNCKHAIVLQVG